jgi:hypothetical protein
MSPPYRSMFSTYFIASVIHDQYLKAILRVQNSACVLNSVRWKRLQPELISEYKCIWKCNIELDMNFDRFHCFKEGQILIEHDKNPENCSNNITD